MKERIGYYDIARGLGIIFVVIGHIGSFYVPFRSVVITFHMALFLGNHEKEILSDHGALYFVQWAVHYHRICEIIFAECLLLASLQGLAHHGKFLLRKLRYVVFAGALYQ